MNGTLIAFPVKPQTPLMMASRGRYVMEDMKFGTNLALEFKKKKTVLTFSLFLMQVVPLLATYLEKS